MPIWAPVGGRPGAAISGHNTGAWSEVIRHTDTGADAGAQPRPRCRTPRRGVGGKNRASLTGGAGLSRVGSWWPKSASRRAVSRPREAFMRRSGG